MANSIQAIRNVYDIEKKARDNNQPMTDLEIETLLKRTVSDQSLISKYPRFEKGYAAEDLFLRLYSLLPWVKTIVPLGQEQYPEKSKENIQVPDYEITYEAGNPNNIECTLVEVKLVDGEKQTLELKKYQYEVLREYALQKKETLLFGIFWRKQGIWTMNSIESFSPKSSCYKISFVDACKDDLSAIFGDYTYLFRKKIFRKTLFTKDENAVTEYIHGHEKYGRTKKEMISCDGEKFEVMSLFEPAMLDCAFDFVEEDQKIISKCEIEIMEICEDNLVYKLSSLMLCALRRTFLMGESP